MFQPTQQQYQEADAQAIEPAYVFVYGTLKSQGRLNKHLQACGGRLIGNAEIEGVALYLFPALFPGAFEVEDSSIVAKGEIWHVNHLYYLDRVESNGELYWRVKRPFKLDSGEIIEAWIYFYLGNITNKMLPLVDGIYDQCDHNENYDRLAEWLTANGYKLESGEDGFEHYLLDDNQCPGECDECPYPQLGQLCLYSNTSLIEV